MIYIGVTGWGDHDEIYRDGLPASEKLKEYAAHFPVVEVDASFYAVQPERNMKKWTNDTPENFHFIVKAYQGMTGHQRGEIPFDSKEEMFEAFKKSLTHFRESGKLTMVLFQFPPWFDCTKENVTYLRWCRKQMGDIPCALEFRNRTWFQGEFYEKTLEYMKEDGWIHSICDEPQAGEGSIPAVLEATDPDKTLIRMHGRNVHGWKKPVKGKEWREIRYLYKYNEAELLEWKEKLLALQKSTKDIYLVFNNNSGGDASGNAKMLLDLMDISYEGLAPRQLDLFN
ncbi:DUF72 domain-containing protein [Metabacillus sp. GX 13764]|uniref:DUF72 domain-containing protein n=1 Tax=Metabacillus kandeliae TaxID=2900151 RepID=UPI001E3B6135|nr:DUF72 domain-containing protein [Metabacillus kandeliae]